MPVLISFTRLRSMVRLLILLICLLPAGASAQGTPPPPTPTISATPAGPALTVAGNSVNIRSGPAVTYAVLGRVSQGDKLSVTGRNAARDWWQVDYKGKPGWIYAPLTRLSGNAAGVPLVQVEARPATTSTPTGAAPSLSATTYQSLPPLQDTVIFGPATVYPVRAKRFIGWGYEIVNAAENYDLILNRDVFGWVAHQLWEDILYKRHPKGIRITIMDSAQASVPGNPVRFGDGESAEIVVGCAPDHPRLDTKLITDPEECVIVISSDGPYLSDIVISGTILGYHTLLSSGPPVFSQAPYSPSLGLAERNVASGQWRWTDPFLQVVSLKPMVVASADSPVPKGPLPPPSGHIAFTRGRDYAGPTAAGVSDIAIVDVMTGEVRVVAQNGRQPDMRNDGRIVFNGEGGTFDDLQVVEADGTNLHPISKHPEDSAARWSDDGARLAFHSMLAGVSDRLFIQSNAEVQEEPMHLQYRNDPLFGRYPFWTSDGLGYSGCIRGSCGIWVTGLKWAPKISDTFKRQLTTFPEDRATDIRADTVLFASPKSGNWDLYTIPAAGGRERNLTDSPSQDLGGAFSPDGNYIAFMSDRGGGWGVWIMETDGANPRLLIAVPEGFGKLWDQDHLTWGP